MVSLCKSPFLWTVTYGIVSAQQTPFLCAVIERLQSQNHAVHHTWYTSVYCLKSIVIHTTNVLYVYGVIGTNKYHIEDSNFRLVLICFLATSATPLLEFLNTALGCMYSTVVGNSVSESNLHLGIFQGLKRTTCKSREYIQYIGLVRG